MEYSTRHLIAQKPFRHEGVDLKPGDPFEASSVDARYYLTRGKARAAAPAAPAAKSTGRGRGRTPVQAPAVVDEVVKADAVTTDATHTVNEVSTADAVDDNKPVVDTGI